MSFGFSRQLQELLDDFENDFEGGNNYESKKIKEKKKYDNILSKKEFTKIINKLKNIDELENNVNSLFRKSNNDMIRDFSYCMISASNSALIRILEKMFKDDDEFISYYIYELDYGKEYKEGSIIDKDNKPIDISTPEKLYDYLIYNMDGINNE